MPLSVDFSLISHLSLPSLETHLSDLVLLRRWVVGLASGTLALNVGGSPSLSHLRFLFASSRYPSLSLFCSVFCVWRRRCVSSSLQRRSVYGGFQLGVEGRRGIAGGFCGRSRLLGFCRGSFALGGTVARGGECLTHLSVKVDILLRFSLD